MTESASPQHAHLHKVDDIAEEAVPRFGRRMVADDEMDITPMIDMTFLLLIFFLVASRIEATPGVALPQAKYGAVVPVQDTVFITLDLGVDGAARVFMGDGTFADKEIGTSNLKAQEEEVIAFVNRELNTGVPRKHQVIIKAAKGLQHREVARIVAALGNVEKLQHVHIGVLEAR